MSCADPVGIADIAERAGVKPDTVKKWTERHAGRFPSPAVTVARGRLWEWAEVLAWLVATGRAPCAFRYRGMPGDDTSWSPGDADD